MNKYAPLLIALAIHILPISWSLFKCDTLLSDLRATSSEGIELNSFTMRGGVKKAGQLNRSKTVVQTKTLDEIQTGGQTAISLMSEQSGAETQAGANTSLADSLILKAIEPVYPPVARQRGFEGKVKLRAFYKNGSVEHIEVIESSGTKMLDESAKKALLSWKLKPESVGQFEKTFQFKLKD